MDIDLTNNLNLVKTSNKLIGEIENHDLYASDEGIMLNMNNNDGFDGSFNLNRHGDGDFRNQSIQFDDTNTNGNKTTNKKFLEMMKSRKEKQQQNHSIE